MESELRDYLRNARDLAHEAICALEQIQSILAEGVAAIDDIGDFDEFEFFRDALDALNDDVRDAIDPVDRVRREINCLADSIPTVAQATKVEKVAS
jgi:hypothetical protein